MTTQTSTHTLPAPADYARAVTALTTAQEAVETLTWRLREIVDSWDEADTETTPTTDDIVAVFTLVDEVDRTTSDLDEKRRQLQDTLRRINLVRLETADAEPA